MTREIVTLQIGNYSNHVGAYFWNQLDVEQNHHNTEIDYNSYFTFNQKTNIPTARVLIIDYRNTFGHLLEENEVNSKAMESNSSVEVIQRPTENTYWSKNLKTKARFHPKSLLPLNDYWYSSNPEENQFDIYSVGQQTYQKMFDQIDNSFHYLLESCDSLQSFRCLYDVNSSFSGLFTSIQDYLHDECPKQPIWSFGLGDKPSVLNFSLSLSHSLMPTVFCFDTQQEKSNLALAIQHSLFSSTLSLDLLADRLCPMNKHLLNLSYQIPFDLNKQTLYHYLEKTDLFHFHQPIACHYFLRGIEQDQLYNRSLFKLNISTSAELLATYLREQYPSRMFISSDSWTDKYDHMSILTGLVNDEKYAHETFDHLLTELKKINYKVLSKRWEENDFDEQAFEQLKDDLNTFYEQSQ